MRKLGANLLKSEQADIYEQIPMLKEAGFDCFFFSYTDSVDVEKIRTIADEQQIEIETVHLPFGGVNSLWEDGAKGEEYLAYLCAIIARCAKADICKAIMHVTIRTVAPPVSEIGKKRFERLFSFAEEQGVQLAIENLEPQPHLQVIMDMLPEYHGYCWDCGHNLCYTPMEDMMAKYGDRLLCTHIHDNRGITRPGDVDYRDDLHLLPFDGNLDWEWFAEKIKTSDYDGVLTLELSLKSKDEYSNIPLQEFFNDAYRRAQKLLSMVK